MMRRGSNGTDTLETINAAATVIASGENRGPHASVQKRRWGSFWSLYWCFGWNKHKRIGHAILSPETTATGSDAPMAEHPSQPPSLLLPFVAPPSSPASFLPSEPPSATQSPTGILSLTRVSANMYSPSGPASMFAIGPYAHETQLVSPPVFSTFTTEPSTAPYTPPPESVQMTTPSSPEVPFARLLEPDIRNGEAGQRYPFSHQYEFQSYHLHPGSPVSHLISPSSGISGSGTSSPFRDHEFAAGHPFFLEFKTGNPPKLLDLEKIVLRVRESCQGSGTVTPDAVGPPGAYDKCISNHQNSDIAPARDTGRELQSDEDVVNHRFSFEITDEEVIRCVEKKPVYVDHTSKASEQDQTDRENEQRHKRNRTITLGSPKEFNFQNVDEENSDDPSIDSSEWLVREKAGNEEGGRCKNWYSFPIIQPEVS